MKIWLPYLRAGSGADVYIETLASLLQGAGHQAVLSPFNRLWQFAPWLLRFARPPHGTQIVLAPTWYGFAFKRRGCKLVIVEFHCVLDSTYAPHRSWGQALYHGTLIRWFERISLGAADNIVAISAFTARSLQRTFGVANVKTILASVDNKFFSPTTQSANRSSDQTFRILFVGNLIRRKGADLLPRIMERLGQGFELHYTQGMRSRNPFPNIPNMIALGRLSREDLRDAYRGADVLLFPTRFEGFGYAAAEAMACGTPAVASNCSSIPEIVEDGVTGLLCPVDDVEAFVNAIRGLAKNPEALSAMGQNARHAAAARLDSRRMLAEYVELFEGLLED